MQIVSQVKVEWQYMYVRQQNIKLLHGQGTLRMIFYSKLLLCPFYSNIIFNSSYDE